jgi:hypothetical protein
MELPQAGNESQLVSTSSCNFDVNEEYLRDYRPSSNLDLHRRYLAIIESLDTTLTTSNSVTEDKNLTTILEDFLVDLEIWAFDIGMEHESLKSVECNESLYRNLQMIFDTIEEKLALLDNMSRSSGSISQLRINRSVLSTFSTRRRYRCIKIHCAEQGPGIHHS